MTQPTTIKTDHTRQGKKLGSPKKPENLYSKEIFQLNHTPSTTLYSPPINYTGGGQWYSVWKNYNQVEVMLRKSHPIVHGTKNFIYQRHINLY